MDGCARRVAKRQASGAGRALFAGGGGATTATNGGNGGDATVSLTACTVGNVTTAAGGGGQQGESDDSTVIADNGYGGTSEINIQRTAYAGLTTTYNVEPGFESLTGGSVTNDYGIDGNVGTSPSSNQKIGF
jgi:hypothetical protein